MYPRHSNSLSRSHAHAPIFRPELFATSDTLVVSFDLETICLSKLVPGTEYRFDPISEVGMSVFDFRSCQDLSPGDRGINWVPKIHSRHFVVKEYQDHNRHNCYGHKWHKVQPHDFAFGSSKFVEEADIDKVISTTFHSFRLRGRTPAEIKSRQYRDVILLTWDSRLEEASMKRLKVDIFDRPGVISWDLQRESYVLPSATGKSGRAGKRSEVICQKFGIPTACKNKQLSHNAGNDAAFTMQTFLAIGHLTPWQKMELDLGADLYPQLKPSFVGYTLDECNIAPPSVNHRRPHQKLPFTTINRGWGAADSRLLATQSSTSCPTPCAASSGPITAIAESFSADGSQYIPPHLRTSRTQRPVIPVIVPDPSAATAESFSADGSQYVPPHLRTALTHPHVAPVTTSDPNIATTEFFSGGGNISAESPPPPPTMWDDPVIVEPPGGDDYYEFQVPPMKNHTARIDRRWWKSEQSFTSFSWVRMTWRQMTVVDPIMYKYYLEWKREYDRMEAPASDCSDW